jgi:hypothetical protein
MAHHTLERPTVVERPTPSPSYLRHAGHSGHAYAALYLGYIALPLIAGADKFLSLFADWTRYLAPQIPTWLGITASQFMKGVGLVEMAAGALVAVKPRWGGAVVGAWLLGIIGNLLLAGEFYDIALRDFGLAVGAYALWQLSARR